MSIDGLFPIEKWNFKTDSILSALPSSDYVLLMSGHEEKRYKKGDVIFKEGCFAAGIFYIINGKIKKYKIDDENREQIIYVANKGEFVGYHAVLAETFYPDSAKALEDITADFIKKEDFLLALHQSAILNHRLIKTLAHEFEVLSNSLSLLTHKSVRERLALQLIVLREKYKDSFHPGMLVEINLSRNDLANIVGPQEKTLFAPSPVSSTKELLRLRAERIIITNIKKLIAIANFK